MIVRDEAFFIEECLASAAPRVDDLVLVDTGSVDGTRQIAARFTDRVFDFRWIDDFAAARNFGLERATGDWILVLDADERINAQGYQRIRDAMQGDRDGFYLQTRSYMEQGRASGWQPVAMDDPDARGYPGFTTHPILKLFRNRPDIRYRGRVHEIVDNCIDEAARGALDVVIHHYGDENPHRPRRERALRYLAIMDEILAERDDGRLFATAGSTAMYYAQDFAKASRYLQRAAELGYQPQASLEGAAEAAYRAGNIGEAQDLYRGLYRGGYRTPSLCLNLANLAVRTGDKPFARSLLEECLALGGLGPQTDEVIERNIRFLAE